MATYCISDIHGCYDEFMQLVNLIQFDPASDTLYILGDVVDRGDRPIDCLRYIMRTKSVHLLLGNHEDMMLAYYSNPMSERGRSWHRNSNGTTRAQFDRLSNPKREMILNYLRKRPLYKTVKVGEKRFFLSHAGLDILKPFSQQSKDDLIWIREEFYDFKALNIHTVVFGHTPTVNLHSDEKNCSVWIGSPNDKICIDSGCAWGGALAALRLDDGAVFYVKSSRENRSQKFYYTADPVPASFFAAERKP